MEIQSIKYTKEETRKKVLENTIKMLTERNLLKREELEKNIEYITTLESSDYVYGIKLVNTDFYYPEETSKTLYIKIIMDKITSTAKTTQVGEFLINHKNNPKIIITKDINSKSKSVLLTEYSYCEVFFESDLMINLIDNELIPKHILLSKEEQDKVREEYDIQLSKNNIISFNDKVARYYNAKLKQMFRIIRPSETSGQVIAYRIVG